MFRSERGFPFLENGLLHLGSLMSSRSFLIEQPPRESLYARERRSYFKESLIKRQ
jgi:hypothetical protein